MNRSGIAYLSSRGLGVLLGGAIALCASAAAAQVSVTIGLPPPPPPPPRVYVEAPPVYVAPPPVYVAPPPPQPQYVPQGPPPIPESILRWGGGLRVSYGIPGGNVFNGEPLSDIASGLVHFEGAVDLVIFRRVVIGANLGIGIGSVGEGFGAGCDADGSSCSVLDFDFGVHTEYRILPSNWVNPWVGLGLEYEILVVSQTVGSDDTSGSFGGVDVDLSAGVDFQLGNLGIGPFLSYRFGTYSSTSETVNGSTVDSADLQRNESHDWLMLGIRGRY